MTALITFEFADGREAVCDENCFGAIRRCRSNCACFGENYAQGWHLAVENTRERHEEWAERLRRSGREVTSARLALEVQLIPLFTLAEVTL